MKISYLELIGYRRFKLSRIQRLEYRPATRQQLILGTNGSGKSSLLDELSPLPARPVDFKPGGSKTIHIEHRGSEYRLRSVFQSSNRHSFVKDGTELNEGGTFQVQTRLVKEHLLYTDTLHDLLTGRIRFTELRPLERRDWITLLSETDWTYAMGVYQTLKSKVRDVQGALRHQQSRLTAETEAFSKLDSVDLVKARVLELTGELNQLLLEFTPGTPQLDNIALTLNTQFSEIVAEATKTLTSVPSFIFDGSFDGLSDIERQLIDIQQTVEIKKATLERANKEHSDLEAIVTTIANGTSEESVVEMESRLTAMQTELKRRGSISRHFTLTNGRETLTDTQTALSELHSIMSTLPDNSSGKYSRKHAGDVSRKITDLQQQVDITSVRLNRIHDRLSHIKEIHDSRCPKCQYIWKEGVRIDEAKGLEDEQRRLSEQIDQYKFDLTGAKQELEEIEDYGATWKRYVGLTQSFPRLQPLFRYLQDNDLLTKRPSENLHVLRIWEHDVQLTVNLEELKSQVDHLTQLVEMKKQFGESVLMIDRLHGLEGEISNLTTELSQMVSCKTTLEKKRDVACQFESQMVQIDTKLIGFTTLLNQAIVSIKNSIINTNVEQRHLELSDLQRRLSDRDTLEGIIRDLESETNKLQQNHRALSLLMTAISPTEGIIADRLREAIFSIIDQMNTVIASVWSYELRVQECGFEGADLDYRFPVIVESPDDLVSDISKCSKGQMEIINIAFKLTAMLYLNMLDYPLFLDEPGEGFDEQHRDQIMSLIRAMLDSGHYSQLFMVSHIATSHGAFLDAQSMVLDASNITVPGTFNEHVTME